MAKCYNAVRLSTNNVPLTMRVPVVVGQATQHKSPEPDTTKDREEVPNIERHYGQHTVKGSWLAATLQ